MPNNNGTFSQTTSKYGTRVNPSCHPPLVNVDKWVAVMEEALTGARSLNSKVGVMFGHFLDHIDETLTETELNEIADQLGIEFSTQGSNRVVDLRLFPQGDRGVSGAISDH